MNNPVAWLFLLFSCSALAVSFSQQPPSESTEGKLSHATVYLKDGEYKIEYGAYDADGVAYGSYLDTFSTNGWYIMKINSNKGYTPEQQLFAAGYLEGAFSAHQIKDAYINMKDLFFGSKDPPKVLLKFLTDQQAWVDKMIKSEKTEPLWKYTSALNSQFDGLAAGCNDVLKTPLPLFAFQLLNGVGDFLDLLTALKVRDVDWENMNDRDFANFVADSGHCSGFVRMTPDFSDLFTAHSSWFTYVSTIRIFKHYNFPLGNFVASEKMSFSSYPGFLESLDDFYMMDSGLAMVQTTNGIYNKTLYELVVPQKLFAWQRVRIANALAKTGKEWFQAVAQYNSGTYNNQYMVVDYNLFTPGRSLPEGTLWVVEQIPGLVEGADVTNVLEKGYWSSYNVPYFKSIYELSGYPEVVAKRGPDYSYQMAPRAQIFRRDGPKVMNMKDMQHIMRENDYQTDPLSHGNPDHAICSRHDLRKDDPSPGGCYDSKITNYEWFLDLKSTIINGPTHQTLAPFKWSSQFNVSHVGTPEVYDFDFIVTDPDN